MKKLVLLSFLLVAFFACKKQDTTPSLVPTLDKIAPEITLNDVNGKAISLSSLRGKVVVLSFWASWCPGCRQSNPALVKLYNKYKDKGLDIYSVSIDTKKSDWEAAIKADGLVWKNHVSELKGWDSNITLQYEVNATPYKLLLDKEGIIRVIGFDASMESEVERWLK
jgi:peroxiredoxin